MDVFQPFDENHITNTEQFKLYRLIISDNEECKYYSTEVKEHALRTILYYIIDCGEQEWLCCFSGPNIYKHVTESFLREFKDCIDWERAQFNFKFSEDFIRHELPIKNWLSISTYQNLSENFIHEFRQMVDWDRICEYQKLSFSFLKRHNKEVNWEITMIYQESWFRRINNLD